MCPVFADQECLLVRRKLKLELTKETFVNNIHIFRANLVVFGVPCTIAF